MSNGKLWAVLVAFLVAVAALWTTILVLDLRPNLGLDLQGGVSITLAPEPGQQVDEDVLEQTVTVIRQRIDALGVAEPDIARQGENILVQLPGAADQAEAEEVVGRTAQLQFRPVIGIIAPDDPAYDDTPDCETLLADMTGPADPDEPVVLCESATGAGDGTESEEGAEVPVEQRVKYQLGEATVVGADVADANAAPDPTTGLQWEVNLTLSSEGAQRFQESTAELACEPPGSPQRRFAIILDNTVDSAPQVSEQVACGQGIGGGRAVITIGGGEEEARDLALLLRAGALPIQLEIATSQNVSPTLGVASLRAGLLAGFLGLLLVAVYLIVLYRGIGLVAVAELAMFGLLVYGSIAVLGEVVGFTLTLAGIAGIIVSIGIAADSSIIYRERYRDEIRVGRTVRTAADHAFAKAWKTNLTGNTVSFLAAVVLYYLAIGPVRGFAFTLGLSTLIDTLLFGTFTRSLFGLIARNPRFARSPWVGLRAQEVAPDAVGATRDPRRKTKVNR